MLISNALAGNSQKERYIVVFEPETFVNEPARGALIKAFGGETLKELPLVNGVAVLLPPQAAEKLSAKEGVVRVDKDIIVEIVKGKPPKNPPQQPSQTLPWGVDRIDAEYAWEYSTGAGVKVAILDTGIDLDHPDLFVAGGYNAINPRKTPDDDNGHGTHCAGIAAALDNDIGVVGVAPDASLYAVKVLNRNGQGFLSDVIEGLQWCIDNGMLVVNMSFGSSSDNQTFHDAITTASESLIQVAAAGNTGGDVIYPAKYDETIAVSATDKSDSLASWSSYGPEIDFAAPGVDIYSTYKGGTYETLSGTSMAAPHVTGTVALVLAIGGTVDVGAGSQTEDNLKGEDTSLTDLQEGEGIVDAEDSVNGDAENKGDNLSSTTAAPALKTFTARGKIAITWGEIKK